MKAPLDLAVTSSHDSIIIPAYACVAFSAIMSKKLTKMSFGRDRNLFIVVVVAVIVLRGGGTLALWGRSVTLSQVDASYTLPQHFSKSQSSL